MLYINILNVESFCLILHLTLKDIFNAVLSVLDKRNIKPFPFNLVIIYFFNINIFIKFYFFV